MVSKNLLIERCEAEGIPVNKSMKKEELSSLISKNINKVAGSYFQGKIFKKIYHCADIHIRYFERHEEYREVFEQLYDTVTQKDSILVIAGDIFHNKDKFVSETMVLFDEFITRISSILPVVAILGNHDCFNNSDRLDSMTGFTSVKNYENFFLIKESGYYNFGNVMFGVSSIKDGILLEAPNFPLETKDTVKIALYHGIVTGASINSQNEVSRDIFKGYDITMLGDVHKRQFITSKMAYPGSLIQQNFKEEKSHGILEWDMTTLQAKYIEVKNNYCYVDVEMEGPLPEFSEFTRVRLVVERDTLETEIKERVNLIKKRTNVISLKNFMRESAIIKKDSKDYEIVDINTKEARLIRDYSEPEYSEELLVIHKELQEQIGDSDLNFKESIPWKINRVSFMNIFSYGGDKLNVVDLKSGVVGILAGNASGKTNILNVLMYGMFGNIYARNQNQNNRNVISRYAIKEGLFVKLEVETDTGKKFFIERTAKKRSKNSKIGLNETLEFYDEENRLNLGTKLETERLVREQLSFMGKDEFILTNMMSNITYGSGMSIVGMCGSQLDEVFNGMFNLNKYKLLHAESKKKEKIINEKRLELSSKISTIEKMLQEIDTVKTEGKIKTNEVEINKLNQELKVLVKELESIDNTLLSLKQVLIEEDENTLVSKIKSNELFLENKQVKPEDEQKLDRELYSLKNIYKEKGYSELIGKPFKKVNLSVEAIKDKIEELKKKKVNIPYDMDIMAEYLAARKALKKVEKEETLDLQKIKKSLENLESQGEDRIIPKDTYDSIMTDLNKQYFDPVLVEKYKKVIKIKEERDSQIETNISIDAEINSLKVALSTKEIETAHTMRDRLNTLSDKLELIDVYRELEEFKVLLKKIRDNSEVSSLLSHKKHLSNSVQSLNIKINTLSSGNMVLSESLCNHFRMTSEKTKLSPELKKLERQAYMYKKYTEVTHSKNLPKALISNAVKSITEDANSLLYNLTGLTCDIEENEKWEMNMTRNGSFIGPDHLSGYERFIANVSLKMAFDKFKVLSSIKLFIIDEVIDCVSEDNFENIDTLFEELKHHYSTVILISHNEDLKKKVDSRIEIEVDGKCSFVCI